MLPDSQHDRQGHHHRHRDRTPGVGDRNEHHAQAGQQRHERAAQRGHDSHRKAVVGGAERFVVAEAAQPIRGLLLSQSAG